MAGKKGRRKIVPVQMSNDRNERLARWHQLHQWLAAANNEEIQLRQMIVQDLFNNEQEEGAETVDIGNNWKLRATKTINLKATNVSGQMENLTNYLWSSPNPELQALAQQLVTRWEPHVSSVAYDSIIEWAKVDTTLMGLLAAAVTETPGMPQLEMIEPKQ